LYIYNSGLLDITQAIGRFGWPSDLVRNPEITMMPVGSKQAALDGLDRLVAKQMIFNRLLVQTHGNSGLIAFGEDHIFDITWDDFRGKGYDTLFPSYSRIYFDGCNVAEGTEGVKFLRAAGSVFLKGMGGEVTGWTSFGLGLPGIVPFIGGHTIHPSGHLVKVTFAPGDAEGTLEPQLELSPEELPYYSSGA
jgi:hypothetical protein